MDQVLSLKDSLIRETEHDYVLDPARSNVWITVGNISVYVKRTDEGVVVDLFPLGHENDDPSLATAYAFFEEAEQ